MEVLVGLTLSLVREITRNVKNGPTLFGLDSIVTMAERLQRGYYLEEIGLLDPLDTIHLYCLHYVYTYINYTIKMRGLITL